MEERAEKIGVGDLSALAARLLRQGKRIAVADEDGEVLGYIVPSATMRLAPADGEGSPFQRLVAAGQVRLATGDILDHLEPDPAEPGEEPLGEAFLRMRDEERY